MYVPQVRSRWFAVAGAFLWLMAAPLLLAQPGPLNYVYSYNASAYNDDTTIMEFNIEFSDGGLVYTRQDDGSTAGELYTRLMFRSRDKKVEPLVVDWVTLVPKPAEGRGDQAMLGSQLVALAPGEYDADLYYQDVADRSRRDSTSFKLTVPSFAGRNLQLSDVIVVNEASQSADHSNPFFRNGYMVLPNVSSVVVPPFLVLNTYLEVYNANQIPTSEYHITYRLADSSRTVFYETQVTRPRAAGKTSVELNSFPLDSLPSGQYYVIVKAYNGFTRSATDSAMVYRSFIVRNPEFDQYLAARLAASAPTAASYQADAVIDPIYAGMKEEELANEYGKVRYIASELERKVWEDLTGAEARGRFLTHFWMVRDPSPGTVENEERTAYFKRVEEAKNLYAAPMAPNGWDSDRGRILLQYGKPDGVERYFQEFNKKPYEVWVYTQRGYQFVFIDRTQTGTFSLTHATAPGEIRNENWEQVATISNSSTGSSSSVPR